MQELSQEDFPCIRSELSRDEAIDYYKKTDEPYKLEILEDIPSGEKLTSYSPVSYTHLTLPTNREV